MLSELLSQKVILINSDEDFKKIEKAANDIAKKIIKDKNKVIGYTLTALDPEVAVDNALYKEVENSITKRHWQTFTVNPADTQVSIIRAVMFEALEKVSKDVNLAALIWLTGRNIQEHNRLIGKERELIQNFLENLGTQIEEKAAELWSIPTKIKIQRINVITDNSAQAPVDPVNSQNQSIEIQQEANNILNRLQTEIIERNNFMQLRSHLLWWKESCYSPTIEESYMKKEDGFLQILLAVDYNEFIPAIFPNSVNYFLKETHKSIIRKQSKKIKLSTILGKIEKNRTNLKRILNNPASNEDKISLYRFVQNLVWKKNTIPELEVLVGISKDIEITLEEFTLWIFHDLQSIKIATIK